MAEVEGRHRRRMNWFLQIGGFVLLLVVLLGGIFLVAHGKSVGGLAMGERSGGLVALALGILVVWAIRNRR